MPKVKETNKPNKDDRRKAGILVQTRLRHTLCLWTKDLWR